MSKHIEMMKDYLRRVNDGESFEEINATLLRNNKIFGGKEAPPWENNEKYEWLPLDISIKIPRPKFTPTNEDVFVLRLDLIKGFKKVTPDENVLLNGYWDNRDDMIKVVDVFRGLVNS